MPVLAVGCAECGCLRDVVPVELDVPDWPSEHPLDCRTVFAGALAEREGLDRVCRARAIDAFWQLPAGERHFEAGALHVGPCVRLIRVAGVEQLLGGCDGKRRVNGGELPEWFDGSHRDLAGGELVLKLLGKLEDS
jgi:hypothetical protein